MASDVTLSLRDPRTQKPGTPFLYISTGGGPKGRFIPAKGASPGRIFTIRNPRLLFTRHSPFTTRYTRFVTIQISRDARRRLRALYVMETSGLHAVIRHVRRVVLASSSDEELLLAIASKRDEDAFEALLRRHGPMVWAVCRRVLRHTQDAEDAFQATFLVLIRKADAIRKRASLPSWLHGVAYRTSHKARVMKARRLVHESQAVARTSTALAEDHSDLDFEVNALPEKYRLPVLLCELQGRTRKEAAELLKIPEGTLSSRLAAARKTLAQRLRLRGACFVVGAVGPARVPAPLALSTVKAVSLVMTGGEAAGVVSANAVVLSQGVLHVMFLMKLKSVVVTALVLGSLGIGAGKFAYTGVAANAVAADEPGGKEKSGGQLTSSDAEMKRLAAELRIARLEAERAKWVYQDSVEKSNRSIKDAEARLAGAQNRFDKLNKMYQVADLVIPAPKEPSKRDQSASDRDLERFAKEAEAAQAQLQAAQSVNEAVMARYRRARDLHQAEGIAARSEIPDSKALQQKLKEAVDVYDRARTQMAAAQAQMDQIRAVYAAIEAKQARDLERSSAQPHSKEFEASLNTLGNQFKYRIPVKVGKTSFNDRNRIEILEIWGTKPKFDTNGQYLVRAKYTMPNNKRGKLYFYETTTVDGGRSNPWDLQTTDAKQGSGEFTLLHGMIGPGSFHLQLLAGESGNNGTLADVYFE